MHGEVSNRSVWTGGHNPFDQVTTTISASVCKWMKCVIVSASKDTFSEGISISSRYLYNTIEAAVSFVHIVVNLPGNF